MLKVIKKTIILFSFVLVCSVAYASTFYISPSGSDATGTGSTANPWATLQKAFANMSSGDTLIIKDGTYRGTANQITAAQRPPSGTSSAWTILKAEHDGEAVFDGEATRSMLDVEYTGNNDIKDPRDAYSHPMYYRFEGILWVRQNGSAPCFVRARGLKFFRCGTSDTGTGPYANFYMSRCADVLIENCYSYGSGRYKFGIYCSTQVVVRQCVARLDHVNPQNEVIALFSMYSAVNCEVQNCIGIDSDQNAYYTNVADRSGTFCVPSTDADALNVNFTNCVGINNCFGGLFTAGNYFRSRNVTFKNCSLINVSNTGFPVNLFKGADGIVQNCTFINGVSNGRGFTGDGGINNQISNSIIANYSADWCLISMNENYNTVWNSTSTNAAAGLWIWCNGSGSYGTRGTHTQQTNPIWNAAINPNGAIKYPVRTEAGNNLSGDGQNGTDIGANCLKMIGVPGTMWGEPGYNTVQSTNMWPFPYEGLIQRKMREYSGGGVSGNRGFCAGTSRDGSPQTLTKYIWEYLGNQIPADIYGGSAPVNNNPTATASASPVSGTVPLTVTFTGSGTDSDGTVASYSWNFGDNTTSAQQSPSHVYTSTGTYNAVLTVTDNGGAKGTASVTVNVTSVPAATYSISGTVRNSAGTALANVTVNLTGGTTRTATTGTAGTYSFTGLPGSAAYTVTPQLSGYTFAPISISTNSLSGNLSGRDFAGTVPSIPTYYISGTVSDGSGNGIPGVTLSITGSASFSTTTASNGYYRFDGLPENGSFVITPVKAGYTFDPGTITKEYIGSNQESRDFTGTLVSAPTYAISGYVRNASGTGVDGVSVTLSGGAARTGTTSSTGYYEFTSLSGGTSYTVTPTVANGTFSPVSVSTNSLGGNLTNRNFTVSYAYAISGTVRNSAGAALSNVTVNLTGGATRTATTGSGGTYSFTGLPGSAAYTVTPQLSGYTFAPVSISTSSLGGNLTGRDFTGTSASVVKYHVGGTVKNNSGSALSGVTLTISGDSTGTVTSATDGTYRFDGLDAGGSYVITPQKNGHVFNPSSVNKTAISSSDDTEDFVGIPLYAVSGYVKDIFGYAMADVTVTLSGSRSASYKTSSNGFYQFTGLPATGVYTIAPSKQRWKFTPSSISMSSLSGDQTNRNFAGKRSFFIRGKVMDGEGQPISGATVKLSGQAYLTTTTDTDGIYEFNDVLEQTDYVVTTSKLELMFVPQSRAVSVKDAPVEGVNFYANPSQVLNAGEMIVIGSSQDRGTINPDNGDVALIEFKGSEAGRFELKIFSSAGDIVSEDHQENILQGVFEWHAGDMASGIYVAHVKGPGIDNRKKIAIVR